MTPDPFEEPYYTEYSEWLCRTHFVPNGDWLVELMEKETDFEEFLRERGV